MISDTYTPCEQSYQLPVFKEIIMENETLIPVKGNQLNALLALHAAYPEYFTLERCELIITVSTDFVLIQKYFNHNASTSETKLVEAIMIKSHVGIDPRSVVSELRHSLSRRVA